MRVAATGVLTGWGRGLAALPAEAQVAAGSRAVIPLATPALHGERFRRATRECILGVAAVHALLADGGLTPDAIRGDGTALIYVTAGAYGASNRAFIDVATGYFPYTAASAVPAEAAIEFGLIGPYVILIGGASATIEALWQANRLLTEGACARVLVLAVETFVECADLYARGRWLLRRPLVEAAASALLVAGGQPVCARPAARPSRLETIVGRRAGETLACAPLIALALAREMGDDRWDLTGEWRGQRMALQATLVPADPGT